MKKSLCALSLFLAAALPFPASADLPISIQIGGSPSSAARPVFSDRDRGLIEDYYSHRKSDLPPGLAKKKHLPPGLQKQMERNGHLPPGLEKRSLPGNLERRLSALPSGYGRVVVGRDVLIIQTSTQQILDILHDIAN